MNRISATHKASGDLLWSITFDSEEWVRILGIRWDGFLVLEGSQPGRRLYVINSRNGEHHAAQLPEIAEPHACTATLVAENERLKRCIRDYERKLGAKAVKRNAKK